MHGTQIETIIRLLLLLLNAHYILQTLPAMCNFDIKADRPLKRDTLKAPDKETIPMEWYYYYYYYYYYLSPPAQSGRHEN